MFATKIMGKVLLLRRLVVYNGGGVLLVPDVHPAFSDYTTIAAQELVASQASARPERSLYRESDAREMLGKYLGGTITLHRDESTGIARLTIANAGKKNAFSGSMMLQLADYIAQLAVWNTGKLLLVRGADGDFCTGADLTFVRSIADPVLGSKMSIFMGSTLSRLHQLPMVSIALVDGYGIGGGAELMCACDLRAISTRAHVGYVHGKLGVSPGWNGGTHLVELLGRRVALRLMASAQMLNADQCMQLGMADFVYDNDQQLDAWISDFVSRTSTETIRASKRIVMNAVECSYVESLSRERDVFAELWGSPKHINALDSLAKK